MGRIMSFDQDGRRVRDFDKSEHDFLRMYGRTPEEVMDENAKLVVKLNAEHIVRQNVEIENTKLRELVSDMWQLINDLDATPYVTERHGNNPAVTWLDDDWSVHESCRERMRELGIEVPA